MLWFLVDKYKNHSNQYTDVFIAADFKNN